jgi:DNA-binding PadR family transcriptional regulator
LGFVALASEFYAAALTRLPVRLDYTEYDTEYESGRESWRCPVTIRHALLALLNESPKYGLQLQQEFESRTGDVWPLNVGQVYTTLQRLERDGLVNADDPDESETAGTQKLFAITRDGQRELDEWLRTPPTTDPPPRDELVIKILIALQMPGVEVHDIIQSHRRELISMMQRYTQIKADASEDDIALAVVADAEIYRLDAVTRWLDSVDARAGRRPPVAKKVLSTTATPNRRRAGAKR